MYRLTPGAACSACPAAAGVVVLGEACMIRPTASALEGPAARPARALIPRRRCEAAVTRRSTDGAGPAPFHPARIIQRSIVLPDQLDPHQVVVLKIQEVVPRELVVPVARVGQLPQLIGRRPLEDPQRLQQLPPPGLCRVLPVSRTPLDMRVVGPAAAPCPPGPACGNVRPLATGRGGGDAGGYGGGLSGPVKGLPGLVCGARHRALPEGGAGPSRRSPSTGAALGSRVTPALEEPLRRDRIVINLKGV
ncbi:hypothetical protein SHL15_7769 [Streptomyces hygroscopicus subsp. limoneus]|nr:hypothetical protein SHL15_7769 [Streptomyces hygroscopicus subsp. limoneus]